MGAGLGVKGPALSHLPLEALALIDGIVQLGEGVAELGGVDEILKPFGKSGIVRLALGKGADLHGVIVDEGGLDQLLLHEGVKELGQDGAPGGDLGQLNIVGFGAGDGVFVGLPVPEVHAGIFLYRIDHGQPFPVSQIDLMALIRHHQTAADLLGHLLHHLFHQVHHAVEIGIGLVDLDGGELRIVLGVHSLIAEDAANLVNALHTAHDQAFQIKLRLDAQDHIHVQRVVVRIEGLGGGADLKGRQNRSIDLQETAAVKKSTQLPQNAAALDEGLLHLGIDDQVHVALTIAELPVRHAVKLFGQGPERLGQQHHTFDMHGDLLRLRLEHVAGDADDIADIILAEILEFLLADRIGPGIELDLALVVLNMAENGLPHAALGHHPPHNGDGLALKGVIVFLDLAGISRALKAGLAEGIPSLLPKPAELIPAHLQNLA